MKKPSANHASPLSNVVAIGMLLFGSFLTTLIVLSIPTTNDPINPDFRQHSRLLEQQINNQFQLSQILAEMVQKELDEQRPISHNNWVKLTHPILIRHPVIEAIHWLPSIDDTNPQSHSLLPPSVGAFNTLPNELGTLFSQFTRNKLTAIAIEDPRLKGSNRALLHQHIYLSNSQAADQPKGAVLTVLNLTKLINTDLFTSNPPIEVQITSQSKTIFKSARHINTDTLLAQYPLNIIDNPWRLSVYPKVTKTSLLNTWSLLHFIILGIGLSLSVIAAKLSIYYQQKQQQLNQEVQQLEQIIGSQTHEHNNALSEAQKHMSEQLEQINQQAQQIKQLKDNTQILKQKLAQENRVNQYQDISKLEALGTLAGGIAHDFNNILSAIFGNTEMCLLTLDENNKARQYVNNISLSAQRAAGLVRQILVFSRMDTFDPHPHQLRNIISEALHICRQGLPSNIIIEQQLAEDCHEVLCDTKQMHQSIINICDNAIDAMAEKGGTLKVILRAISFESSNNSLQLAAGEYLRLTFKDQGTGISAANLERVFDPFFSTKEVGKGTGLGLAVVYGVMQSHHGKIIAKSQENKGTTITLYLPTTSTLEKAQKPHEQQAYKRPQRNILLVEDEVTLVNLYIQFLNKFNYDITVANNGKDALAIFEQSPQHFDIVITDQSMPKMTGKELAIALLQIREDLPIILSTGYSEVITPKEAQTLGIKKYLIKPIKLSELHQSIESCFELDFGGETQLL